MDKNTLFALTLAASGVEGMSQPDFPLNTVVPQIPDSSYSITQSDPTCFVFAHGRGGNKHNVHYYYRHSIVRSPFFSFNFPDAANGIINYKETSLAQENEICAFKEAFDQLCVEYESKFGILPKVVLTGVSRGASSIITFMATHNPENVCALVIESPFDAVHSVITGILRKVGLSKSKKLHKLGHFIMAKVHAKYDKNAPTPLDMIPYIKNKKLPILIVCSREDELVPWDSSYRVFEEFKKQGFENVHILINSHGKHVRILEGRCADVYKCTADTFYKCYLNL